MVYARETQGDSNLSIRVFTNSFVIVIINFSSKNSEKLYLTVLSSIYGIIFLFEGYNRII
jgi:hypothetical protein